MNESGYILAEPDPAWTYLGDAALMRRVVDFEVAVFVAGYGGGLPAEAVDTLGELEQDLWQTTARQEVAILADGDVALIPDDIVRALMKERDRLKYEEAT